MTISVAAEIAPARSASWWRWETTDTKMLVLGAVLGIVCGVLSLIYARGTVAAFGSSTSRAHGDFFALWSYGKIAAARPATDLYNFATLHARQVALGMTPSYQNPFPYPPVAILLFLPLSLASYHVAYALWEVVTFALFLWAVVATCWRTPGIVLPTMIAPMTSVAVSFGQSGFLSGALLIGGLRLAADRPVISGILLGLLSYKPQLGVLVPVGLVAAGLWRPLAVASVTAIVLAVTATVTFGWDVWPAWVHMLPAYSHWFAQVRISQQYILTVQGNLRLLGISQSVANTVQAISAIAMAIIVWRCFRHGASEQASAALLVATFLCTPHAFVYDGPMLTGALALFVGPRVRAKASFSLAEVVVLALAVVFPIVMVWKNCHVPVGSPVLLAWLVVIVRDHYASVPTERLAAPPLHSWRRRDRSQPASPDAYGLPGMTTLAVSTAWSESRHPGQSVQASSAAGIT